MTARSSIAEVVAALRRGGVVAYPTEAVWGLGCDPRDETATLRLLVLKQREVDKGLILIAADEAQLAPFIDMDALDAAQRATVRASWPGPHTWVMPAAADAPAWITGGRDSIAVRISAHPVVTALCEGFGGALVSTSANRGGEPPAYTRGELDPLLDDAIDGIVAGETGGLAQPTPIRVALDGSVLRF